MKRLIYAPPWATAGLSKFRKTPYGDCEFRVIWGPSKMRIVGGHWDDNAKREYRLLPQYGNNPRWIMERWRPPSLYGTPQSWNDQTLTPEGFLGLGPFPHRGRFEHIATFGLSDAKERPVKGWAGFVPLEAGLVEMMARYTWMGRTCTYWELKRELEDSLIAKEVQHDKNFDDMWDDRQLTRPGLSLGAGGAFNKQVAIDDYARRIERLPGGGAVDGRRFRAGMKQL